MREIVKESVKKNENWIKSYKFIFNCARIFAKIQKKVRKLRRFMFLYCDWYPIWWCQNIERMRKIHFSDMINRNEINALKDDWCEASVNRQLMDNTIEITALNIGKIDCKLVNLS